MSKSRSSWEREREDESEYALGLELRRTRRKLLLAEAAFHEATAAAVAGRRRELKSDVGTEEWCGPLTEPLTESLAAALSVPVPRELPGPAAQSL